MEPVAPLNYAKDMKEPVKLSRRSFIVRIGFVGMLVFIIIVSTIITVLHNSEYQFQNIKTEGTTTFASSDVMLFTESYFQGKYLNAIPRSSTLLFSKERFSEELKKKFPIIEFAYITFPEPTELNIVIKEKTPVVVWCFTNTDCGFVDDKGILYGHSPKFSDGVYPVFQSQSDNSIEKKMGTVVVDPAIMYRFAELFKRLQSDDIELSKVMFYEDGDIGFSIDKLFGLYTRDDARLLGTFGQDDDLFVRDMLTGLGNETFKKQFNGNPKDLEYIDMRFPGKIFYKFASSQKPLEQESELNFD
jgi:hypothetical protein